MKISEGRINFLSREIARNLLAGAVIEDFGTNELTKEVKKGFVFFLQKEVAVDQKVREKIASIKRGVPEGSAEWEVLYRQYYEEEIQKI